MKIVVQRVKEAKVSVDGQAVSSINRGLLLFVGFSKEDREKDIHYLAKKIANLRIFNGEDGKMNLSLLDVKGSILSISQFTLYGDTSRGRRPSFASVAEHEVAEILYNCFNESFKNYGVDVQAGVFGANMDVSLVNDGPVTFILEDRKG